MEARTLDIAAGIVTFVLFIILLLGFQYLGGGFGYIFALILFLIIMSVAGYFINEKIG